MTIHLQSKNTQNLSSEAGWRWYGYGVPYPLAALCNFHLCTKAGGFLISTIGDYRPIEDKIQPLYNNLEYLSVIQEFDYEDPFGTPVVYKEELETRGYRSAIEAERGHYLLCRKYSGHTQKKIVQ